MLDELVALEVNGSKQWLLIRGADRSKPVVLFVHGGPGYPLMWYSRAFDEHLLEEFVVVHWDQRMAGKSASSETPIESVSLSQIVDDGLEVVSSLRLKFPKNNIILVGHSWGTLVAANMVSKAPSHFLAYMSVGTCGDWLRAETTRHDRLLAVARERGDQQAISGLMTLGPPPYSTAEAISQFGSLIIQLVGFSWTLHSLSDVELSDAMIQNKEYTETELQTAFEAIETNLDHLGPFLNSYVLQQEIQRLDVPTYFAEGTHDMNTPSALSREYFNALVAPAGKHWFEFKQSAHMPMYEEPTLFLGLLRSIVDRVS